MSEFSDNFKKSYASAQKVFGAGAGFGVFWFVWGKLGFWWGVLYGIFWPIWAGYRIAEWAWR